MLNSSLFWFVLENGVNLLQGFLFFYFIMGYLTPKWKLLEKHYWLLAVVLGLILSGLNATFTEPIMYFLPFTSSLYITLLIFFSGSFFWKLSLLICHFAIYLLIDILTYQIVSSVVPWSYLSISQPTLSRFWGLLIGNLLYAITTYVIRKYTSTKINSTNTPRKLIRYNFYIIILPFISVYFVVFYTFIISKDPVKSSIIIYNFAILFFVNIILLSQYRKLAMDISRSSSNQWLQQYLQQEGNKLNQLMSHYLRSNQLIHDLKNRLLPIQYALENHQLIEAETSLQSLMGNFPQLPVSHPQDTFPNKSNLIIKQNSPHFPSLTLRLEIVPPNYPIDPEISQLLTNWLEQVSRNASQTAANNPILMEGLLAALGERIYLQIQLPVTLVKQCGKNFFRFHALRQRITEYKGFYYDDIVDDLLLITLTLPQKGKETVI